MPALRAGYKGHPWRSRGGKCCSQNPLGETAEDIGAHGTPWTPVGPPAPEPLTWGCPGFRDLSGPPLWHSLCGGGRLAAPTPPGCPPGLASASTHPPAGSQALGLQERSGFFGLKFKAASSPTLSLPHPYPSPPTPACLLLPPRPAPAPAVPESLAQGAVGRGGRAWRGGQRGWGGLALRNWNSSDSAEASPPRTRQVTTPRLRRGWVWVLWAVGNSAPSVPGAPASGPLQSGWTAHPMPFLSQVGCTARPRILSLTSRKDRAQGTGFKAKALGLSVRGRLLWAGGNPGPLGFPNEARRRPWGNLVRALPVC